MRERWYKEAILYSLDVRTFQDSNGDGVGDLCGLTSRLDYLASLGVNCLWLQPIHPSPFRDYGYDITDYYGIEPSLGTLGEFADFMHEASNRGLRVMLDLVVNHTSSDHPWFQEARSDRNSPYRDWYVWSDDEPPDRFEGMVFPGVQKETWTFDETAQAWYRHRFYDFEPDLNTTSLAVRNEILRIIGFWLSLGVSGFRVDAAPFVIERRSPDPRLRTPDFDLLGEWHDFASWRRGDAVFLAEANVPTGELQNFFGSGDGRNDRLQMLFDFLLNQRMFLALARGSAEPIIDTLSAPVPIGAFGQWSTFLRNHDEGDFSRLSQAQRDEVFAAFGPKPEMQLYGRGIRRRLAPMLDGDERRVRLANALFLTLPGTCVIRYGEEIGMGEDLSLPERNAIRTPMQWTDDLNGGFSRADPKQLILPVVSKGPFAFDKVNVDRQRRDPNSLLLWFSHALHTLREHREVGLGSCTVVDGAPSSVLMHVMASPSGATLFIHNLSDSEATVRPGRLPDQDGRPIEVLSDAPYPNVPDDLGELTVNGYGYRWIRIRHSASW